MALDDFMEGEVAIAAGLTAALFSPRVRGVLRRGAVMGLAGVMTAGDAVIGAAKSAAGEARARTSTNGSGQAMTEAPAEPVGPAAGRRRPTPPGA
jgi:hypothetical protein